MDISAFPAAGALERPGVLAWPGEGEGSQIQVRVHSMQDARDVEAFARALFDRAYALGKRDAKRQIRELILGDEISDLTDD